MKSNITEAMVLKACLEFLRRKGIWACRQNQGTIPLPGGGFRRFVGLRGVVDILGVLPGGRFLAVEVKNPKGGRVSPEQNAFLNRVTELGGVACVVTSVQGLEDDLKEAGVL